VISCKSWDPPDKSISQTSWNPQLIKTLWRKKKKKRGGGNRNQNRRTRKGEGRTRCKRAAEVDKMKTYRDTDRVTVLGLVCEKMTEGVNSMNKLLAYIINERLTELVEHQRILTQSQGGFHQDKSTDINSCKLYDLTRKALRLKRRFLRVDIDFKSAFNSMIQVSLWSILEAYGIPDVDLLKSLYEHTTVRLPESTDMGRAKITFNTGVAQGSVLSPLLFSLFINALSLYLSDIGREKEDPPWSAGDPPV